MRKGGGNPIEMHRADFVLQFSQKAEPQFHRECIRKQKHRVPKLTGHPPETLEWKMRTQMGMKMWYMLYVERTKLGSRRGQTSAPSSFKGPPGNAALASELGAQG